MLHIPFDVLLAPLQRGVPGEGSTRLWTGVSWVRRPKADLRGGKRWLSFAPVYVGERPPILPSPPEACKSGVEDGLLLLFTGALSPPGKRVFSAMVVIVDVRLRRRGEEATWRLVAGTPGMPDARGAKSGASEWSDPDIAALTPPRRLGVSRVRVPSAPASSRTIVTYRNTRSEGGLGGTSAGSLASSI